MSSSSSSYLKLSSCRDQNRGFLGVKDDLLTRTLFLRSPVYHVRNDKKKKNADLKLSLAFSSTGRVFRPVSLSSSHTQAEVENQELQLVEPLNTNSNEVEAQTIRVNFQLQRECAFGQHFLIVGDDPVLGSWDPNNAIPLIWSDGHVWTVALDIPIGKCIKFKFVMQESEGKFMWQPGPDRVLETWETEKTITLCEDWENPDLRTFVEVGPASNQTTEEPIETPEKQIVADHLSVPAIEDLGDSKVKKTKEPKGYAFELKERLITHEGVPVLVADLSPLPTKDTDQEEELVNETPKVATRAKPLAQKDQVESTNGAVMVSAEMKLPELNSKEEHVNIHPNLTQRTQKMQDSCDKEHQETQELGQEQDGQSQTSQPIQSQFLNDIIEWGKNALQKILNSLGLNRDLKSP